VGQDVVLRYNLIKLIHTSPFGGHSGVEVTYTKLSSWFYWKGMKKAVSYPVEWVRGASPYYILQLGPYNLYQSQSQGPFGLIFQGISLKGCLPLGAKTLFLWW